MSSPDFLRRNAETRECEHFIVAGAVCSFSTNFKQLLQTARDTFPPIETSSQPADFSIRIWVDKDHREQPPWPKPHVRGLDHLVFAGFNSGSSIVADLRTRRVIGRFSPPMAADASYWKTVIFPIMLTVVGASVGIAELHCACVARGACGLLLAGPSGSGKSTLSLALAQSNMSFLSDDRTFVSINNKGKALAWGLPTRLKLRNQSAQWFRELRHVQPTDVEKGELVFRFDAEQDLGLKRSPSCEPAAIVFLERQAGSMFLLTPMGPDEALRRLEHDLIAELPDAAAKQVAILAKLVEIPCWRLRYGGPVQAVARDIAKHLMNDPATILKEAVSGPSQGDGLHGIEERTRVAMGESICEDRFLQVGSQQNQRVDPIRRFVRMRHAASLPLMGRSVRIETNDERVMEHVTDLLSPYPESSRGTPDFLWQIVCEPQPECTSLWPRRYAFSDHGLRFVAFGQNNFLMVDLEARRGIARLAENLVKDRLGLTSPFLDTLLCLTVGSLGLVPLWANCVAQNHKGVLLFGAANSGKTSTGHIAAKLGLDFHADEGVFLETDAGELRSWAGFWPAVFRPEALRFFPELETTTRPCHHRHLTLHHLVKLPRQRSYAYPVKPVCCVFLQRQVSAVPTLSPIAHGELTELLAEKLLFQDEDRFRNQEANSLRALAKVPGFLLRYGDDPGVAAATIKELIVSRGAT